MRHTITGHAKCAGVIGWPISHSKSPQLHGYWLAQHDIDGAYIPMPVHPESLEKVLRALPLMGFSGVNVTLPHKNETMKIVDHLDSLAKRVGAVNTVVVREDGSLEGRNTDVFGFIENLKDSNILCKGKPATVLGAGGASRAILVALQDMEVSEIRLINRSRSKAEGLLDELRGYPNSITKIRVMNWDEVSLALTDTNLVVNTTSLGMVGQPPLDIDLSNVPLDATVTDIVYSPLLTDFLKQAKSRGLKTVDGLGMLLHQARPAFNAWFGKDPTVTEGLRRYVLDKKA